MLNETECEEIFVLTDECEIPVCSRKIYSRGMCNLHYQRNRILEKGGVTPQKHWPHWWAEMCKEPKRTRTNPDGQFYRCSTMKCDNSVYAKGLCHKHYMKERRT